ncbi:MAG: hypothetical protein DWQ34_06160 [Planctomycetota bacterium]|nr:MAG: hypothetical protein DWQ34_06160 [Planctomycetota bacterium]
MIASGCEPLNVRKTQQTERSVLSPLVAPKDGIELQVYFVERPRGDILVGEALWSGIAEGGGIDAQTSVRLRKAGFRCGLTPSNPPRQIRAIVSDKETGSAAQKTRYQEFTLLSGDSAELEAAVYDAPVEFQTPALQGESTRRYDSARCVLRVSAQRDQEGWVRLQVLPEIHHGESQVRRVASDQQWTFKKAQQIDELYEQRIDLQMNLGEILVLGAGRGEPDSIGSLFFFDEEGGGGSERVLIIRVTGMQQVDPVRADGW